MSRWPDRPRPARDPQPRPTLFLDRDGVILVDKDYLDDPAGVELVPGAAAALRRARRAGWRLVGVSNQSGLGRGRFGRAEFAAVMARLDAVLNEAGCPLDAFFYCPHAPQDDCDCRKPRPGLLEEAAQEMAWDPEVCWVIGDKVSDVDLALGSGMRAILVRTGHGTVQEARLAGRDAAVCDDLAAAVARVLEEPA